MRFNEIQGREHVKRVCEVALVGGHRVLFQFEEGAREDAERFQLTLDNYGGSGICQAAYTDQPIPETSIRVIVPVLPSYRRSPPTSLGYGEPDERMLQRVDEAIGREEVHHESLEGPAESLLKAAIRQLGYNSVQVQLTLGVASTIARMAGRNRISAGHLAEAIQYGPRRLM